MSFHALATLSGAAIQALAQACSALVSGEGQVPASEREREQLQQLFTLLAFLEPRLEPQKVAVLQRLANDLGIEAAMVNDLEQVCRGHVLKAFGDLYRRTFAELNHDVHHVIGGYGTDPDGELQVLAFSMGLFPDHALLIAIPPLLQFQMGIADPLAGSVAPKLTDQLRAPAFAAALERGATVVGPIRDPHWDFWTWIERPLAAVRRDLHVV